MIVALSPYHLTTREPPAMASLLLAERVVTLVPAAPEEVGGDERARFERAVRTVRPYHTLLDSWRWCEELWRAGVITSTHDGMDPAAEVRAEFERLASGAHAALEPIVARGIETDPWGMLGAIAKDLLRGGPDPAISLPVAAGLDAFAARMGLICARSAPASLAQRLEEGMGMRLAGFTAPILVQAEGERLLEAREALAGPIDRVRARVAAVCAGESGALAALRDVTHAYATAFEEIRSHLTRCDDPMDLRVVVRTVSISLVGLPADCVLRAASLAARQVRMTRERVEGAPSEERLVGMVVRAID